jgi:hypothetical protein
VGLEEDGEDIRIADILHDAEVFVAEEFSAVVWGNFSWVDVRHVARPVFVGTAKHDGEIRPGWTVPSIDGGP